MSTEPATSEVNPANEELVPAGKSKFARFLVPALMLGGLLLVVGLGTFFHFRSSKALREEVLAVKKELKEKGVALEDMTAQVTNLSKQMKTLKEYSVARSHTVEEKKMELENEQIKEQEKERLKEKEEAKKAEQAEAIAEPVTHGAKAHVAAEKPIKTEVAEPAKAKSAKAKAIVQKPVPKNCDLAGKSPEDQAATLKHCVSLLEPQ